MAIWLSASILALADDKSDAEAKAKAALALAKARANQPMLAAKSRAISYADAVAVAKKTGKPIFVSVGLDCQGVCSHLRPDFVTCHEKQFENDSRPRALLIVPDKDGSLFRVQTWLTLPAATEVKHAAEAWKKKVSADQENDAALFTALLTGTIAVQPADYVADPLCPGGICPAPVVTLTSRALGEGDTLTGSGSFFARFPRLARFRAGMRAAFDLPPPRVAGGFYSFAPTRTDSVAEASPVRVAEAKAAAGKLTPEHLRKLKAAGIDFKTILELLIKYGPQIIQIVIELLDAFKAPGPVSLPEKVGFVWEWPDYTVAA
jgi:hypothetical protein